MSIYDLRTRAGNPRNPAKALYSYWYSVLKPLWKIDSDGYPTGSYQFGHDRGYGIGPLMIMRHMQNYPVSEIGTKQYPHIGFGPAWGYGGSHTFLLSRTGEFRMWRFHGIESRNRVARATFLDWERHASRYQWFVNTGEQTSKWGTGVLSSWRNPVHYIEESLAAPGYSIQEYWLKLVHDPAVVGNWRIVFSRMSEVTKSSHYAQVNIPQRFERYEELRKKRIRLARDSELISLGQLTRVRGRIQTSTEIEQRRNEQALALAAHLDVGMSAKTTPLKRPTRTEV